MEQPGKYPHDDTPKKWIRLQRQQSSTQPDSQAKRPDPSHALVRPGESYSQYQGRLKRRQREEKMLQEIDQIVHAENHKVRPSKKAYLERKKQRLKEKKAKKKTKHLIDE